MDRDHFARIVTPHGSVVEIRNLTEGQAAHIEGQFAGEVDTPLPVSPDELAETATCGRCQGAGGWNEPVEVTTPSGGKVVTQKWVNCRPCGGTGRVPKT